MIYVYFVVYVREDGLFRNKQIELKEEITDISHIQNIEKDNGWRCFPPSYSVVTFFKLLRVENDINQIVELSQQSRLAIKAWCDNPDIELEYTLKDNIEWKDKSSNHDNFYIDQYYYRVTEMNITKMKEIMNDE